MVKINLEALKQKIQAQKEKQEGNYSDPSKSLLLKVLEPGEVKFRVVPYPHNPDPESDPFPVRMYHYGIPGEQPFYCPKNLNQECHVCEFVWAQLKARKGTEGVKDWSKFLPKHEVFLPGLIRGREEEGPKFLKLSTFDNKMGKVHAKVFDFFFNEDTQNWMDPQDGFDLVVKFVAPTENQKRIFRVPAFLGDVDLARKSTPFGTDKEYKKFVESIPDLDKEFRKPKTQKETAEILKKWSAKLDGSNLNAAEEVEIGEVEVKEAKPANVKTQTKVKAAAEEKSSDSDEMTVEQKLKALGL